MSFVPSYVVLAAVPGTVLLASGVIALRRRWSRARGAGPYFVALGWGLVVAGIAAFVLGWGGEVGTAYALLALGLVAYGVVAAGMQFRTARNREPRSKALEPEDRRTNWARGTAKAFLAIVLAGVTSIGLGVAFAVAMPLGAHDRIVIGGVLVPLLWGGGMAWTLCDSKLLRATAVLLCASAFGYGVAFLPKWFA